MRVASSLLVAAVVLIARPAWPCSIIVPGLEGAAFPFEGRTVPANGVLRAYGFGSTEPIRFVSDDGVTTVAGLLDRDEVSLMVVPETALTPGPWRLVVEAANPEPETPPREVRFTLGLDDDLDPPAPPIASATNHLRGELFPFDSCASNLHDVIVIEASTNDSSPAGIVVGERSAAVDDNGTATLIIFNDAGGVQGFDVVVRDLADNESEPTFVEVWTGCEGACASGDPALPVALVGLAFLRRRRQHR